MPVLALDVVGLALALAAVRDGPEPSRFVTVLRPRARVAGPADLPVQLAPTAHHKHGVHGDGAYQLGDGGDDIRFVVAAASRNKTATSRAMAGMGAQRNPSGENNIKLTGHPSGRGTCANRRILLRERLLDRIPAVQHRTVRRADRPAMRARRRVCACVWRASKRLGFRRSVYRGFKEVKTVKTSTRGARHSLDGRVQQRTGQETNLAALRSRVARVSML